MNRDEQILMTEEFVRQNLDGYDSGHDWWHIVRVRKLASFINDMELLADPFTVDIAALLHDTAIRNSPEEIMNKIISGSEISWIVKECQIYGIRLFM